MRIQAGKKDQPFVVVNCGGIPDTLTERFFSMRSVDFPLCFRSNCCLLRAAVQDTSFKPVGGTTEITVDMRIIPATNKQLENEVVEGRSREDLFSRLNVIPIKVPPLRERKGDVAILAQHFAEKYSKKWARTLSNCHPMLLIF